MERESFEDEEVAKLLNENFVSIKVDREERPDIDSIYMSVCQILTGHGGWPLTIIMSPDKKPFYAGTYFPKNDKMGLPGLMTILKRVSEFWTNKRGELIELGNKLISIINQPVDEGYGEIPDKSIIHEAFSEYKYSFDIVYGGFGNPPKFPTPHNLYFLLRYWYLTKEEFALEMVEKTLDAMYSGGIYDHIGFGFSRYSTDRQWLIPHFEKMLYDNALLAIAYLEAYHATGKNKYAEVAKQIFTYVLRDMTSPEGGFYSAEDADSEGVEGKFYVWTPDEIESALGKDDAKKFCEYYNITVKGNFEGKNIPNLIETAIPENEKEFIERCREKLFIHREKRVHPYKDDKILTAWNGLMIAALATGGRILSDETYTHAAEKAVEFIFKKLIRQDGRLLARYREGESAFPAYVDDYASLVWGLLELYETSYNPEYLKKALLLNDDMIRLFWDREKGGLFMYGHDGEQLIIRPKEVYDDATPSGNSVATLNFLRLARLTGSHALEEFAQQQFRVFGGEMLRAPRAHGFLLCAFMFMLSPAREIILVENEEKINSNAMLKVLRENYNPFSTSLLYSEKQPELRTLIPFVENYKAVEGKTTAYICENFACQAPITDAAKFREALKH
ncbi:MAG TPA: thioredoxin domain-containing protein [Clostridiaceae bacterium]|nr:thioredoxin domain-containing protein [Clostridiaceae bacterium]